MRVLGIGDHHSLGDMYLRLQRAGHDVRVFVSQAESHSIFSGLNARIDRWEDSLGWIRDAGDDGIIVFETASQGPLQDELRAQGFQVFGSSTIGDRLENDRLFGQEALRQAGLQVAPVHRFNRVDAALAFLRTHPGRYVFKVDGSQANSMRTYVGMLPSGADLEAVLQMEQTRLRDGMDEFILMQHLNGVEVGLGAYFDGERFVGPVCLDWEHKRFFPGDLGEMTGEMGTVVTYQGGERLFSATLARLVELLRDVRYLGYINLNTIVNDEGVWPLEFTCRFGYPGFAVCDALHLDDWGHLFKIVMTRNARPFRTRKGYSVGVVLTVPPFPYEEGYPALSRGLPIHIDPSSSRTDHRHFHFGEVEQRDGGLYMAGSVGFAMTVTGVGATVSAAQSAAYRRVRRVSVPNLRYRNDIGERLRRTDLSELRRLGWLASSAAGT